MSTIVKTATIPHLTSSRQSRFSGRNGADLLTASEDELAQLGEATLARLKSQVAQVAVKDEEPSTIPISDDVVVSENTETDGSAVDATTRVVEQILERSNGSIPMVLLFVGSEPNQHVDEICARVASSLCEHSATRVLLVDSDTAGKNLTAASKKASAAGITEIIEYNQKWRSNLLRSNKGTLDFIPIGKGKFGRWNQKKLLRKAVSEMKTEYQFVCVSGGDAHGKAAKLWANVCDGSFLLVSVKNSNGTIAKSAVAELKSNEARLLGCVVTDVDNK